MKMLKLEILEEKTRILFDKLATHWYDFPLVWGTWLSLQIWHRTSVDLDFVVPRFVNHKDIQIFRKLSQNLEIVYQSKEQINMFVDGVKVTIFSYWWKESFPLKKYKKLKIRYLRDEVSIKTIDDFFIDLVKKRV